MIDPVVSPWLAVRIFLAMFLSVFGVSMAFRTLPGSPASLLGAVIAALGLGFLWLAWFAQKR